MKIIINGAGEVGLFIAVIPEESRNLTACMLAVKTSLSGFDHQSY